MDHEPTEEQRAILDFVRDDPRNLVVEALAGSGKTSTALEALKVIPQRSILMAAFSKPIAEELKHKLPKMPRTHAVHVKTFHALGLGIITASYPHLQVDGNATEELVTKVCKGRAVSFQTRRYILKLVKLLKDTTIELNPESETVLDLAHEHDIFGIKATEDDIETALDRVLAAYEASRDLASLTSIDFCDMTWLPSVCNLPPSSRYQAIIVDELQDISEPQFALLQHVMLPTTRIIAIGDRRQAIYSWRGGMGERAWAIMQDHFKAETLWLSTTFRCSKLVVEQANRVLEINGHDGEALKAMPDANDGTISTIALADLPHQFVGGMSDVVHSFVLSRRNDDLLACALFLHRSKVKFQLIGGKDMLFPLFELLDYKLDMRSIDGFKTSLGKWKAEQTAKAEKLDSPTYADRVIEQYNMLAAAAEAVPRPTMIKGLLHAILSDNKTGVWLSTVHKMKGLEAQRVFLLKESFARHRQANQSVTVGVQYIGGLRHEGTWETILPQEELNIEYVAITRAKEHLVWVSMDRSKKPEVDVNEAIQGLKQLGDDMLRKSSTKELEIMFTRAEREAQRLDGIDQETSDHWTDYAGKILIELQARSKAMQ